jgi:hypothetical protein
MSRDIEVRSGKVFLIPVDHEHFYHGPHCPVLVSAEGKCNNDCLERCWAHGPNCRVGICLSCFLYGRNGRLRTTFHHFYPELLNTSGPKRRKRKS